MRRARDRAVGALALLCATVSWGVGGPMFREVRAASSVLRLSWRGQASVCFSAVPLGVVLLASSAHRATHRGARLGALAVGTCMFAMFVGWNVGIDRTAFSRVAVLAQTHPLFIGLFGAARKRIWGVGRAPARGEWCGIVVAFVGVALTASARGRGGARKPPTAAGDAAALGCGVFSAAYALAIQRWFGAHGAGIPNAHPVYVQATAATVMTLWSFLVLAAVPGQVWVSSAPPYDKGVFDWPKSDDFWPGVVSIGSLAIMGHMFLTFAMLKLPLIVCSLAMTLTPVLQTLFSAALLDDDTPSPQGIAGGMLVICGIAISLFFGHRDAAQLSVNEESERSGVSLCEVEEAGPPEKEKEDDARPASA